MLGRIWTAYTVEIWKAIRRRQTYTGPALLLALLVVAPFVQGVTHDGRGDYGYIAYVTSLALGLLGVVLLLIYCAGLVSQEMGGGSIRAVLVRPLRRHEYLAAKLMAGCTYALLLAAIVVFGSWGMAYALGDLIGVNFGGELLFSSDQMLIAYLLGSVLAPAPLFAAAAYGVMVSTFTRKPVFAIVIAVGAWVTADIVKHPLGIDRFVFSSYLESPWQVFINRCDGMDVGWFPMAWQCLGISAIYGVAFTAVAILVLHLRNFSA